MAVVNRGGGGGGKTISGDVLSGEIPRATSTVNRCSILERIKPFVVFAQVRGKRGKKKEKKKSRIPGFTCNGGVQRPGLYIALIDCTR